MSRSGNGWFRQRAMKLRTANRQRPKEHDDEPRVHVSADLDGVRQYSLDGVPASDGFAFWCRAHAFLTGAI